VAAPRERPDRIASTIFIVLALVCALTGLIVAALVESQAWIVVIATLFQTLLFAALAVLARNVEDIKDLVQRMPAPDDATDGGSPTDPGWNETWRLHDQLGERD
jgi:hypothetical protein